MSGTEELGNR